MWRASIGIIAILLFSYGAYTKFSNPFASPYTVHAVFANANGLRPDSLVRIAGVNVGKVTSVSPVSGCRLKVSSGPQQPCSAADVTMTISDNGLPIHKDATFAIRPRIFLEGNFFVDVHPGTPEAPVAPSGFVFPIQQGTDPVQFDQLLTSLQNNTRLNLQILLQEYGQAVKQGGPAYNASIQYWTPAYKYGGEVAHDTLGTQPHDLSSWIDKGGVVNGALSKHPQNLENLVTDFNTTALAFARQNQALSGAVAELPRTLGVAIPALNALESDLCTGPQVPNCSAGPLRLFAQRLVPGVQSTGPMVDASLPLFHQLRLLVAPSELGGLTNDLSGHDPGAGEAQLRVDPVHEERGAPRRQLPGQGDPAVDEPDDPGPELQRLQRVPAAPGVRRGRRLPPRPRRRVARLRRQRPVRPRARVRRDADVLALAGDVRDRALADHGHPAGAAGAAQQWRWRLGPGLAAAAEAERAL